MRARKLPSVIWDRLPPGAPRRPSASRPAARQPTVLTRAESTLLLAAVPLLAVSLWILGVAGADPRRAGDSGLLSLVSPPMVAALVLLTLCLLAGLYLDVPDWLLGLHLVSYLALVHGTAALVADLTGRPHALRTATWVWLALTLVILLVLRYPAGRMTRHRRLVWLALWLFVTATGVAGAV